MIGGYTQYDASYPTAQHIHNWVYAHIVRRTRCAHIQVTSFSPPTVHCWRTWTDIQPVQVSDTQVGTIQFQPTYHSSPHRTAERKNYSSFIESNCLTFFQEPST